jgi:hypothetical protein
MTSPARAACASITSAQVEDPLAAVGDGAKVMLNQIAPE